MDDEILREYASLSSAFSLYSLRRDYDSLRRIYPDKVIYTLCDSGIMRCGELIIPREAISGYATHDVYNLTSALALSDGERDDAFLPEALASHKPLSHRCEKFLESGGVTYIDSSIDTSPDRTLETLSSLRGGDIILLLGGKSKGESYATLTRAILEKCKGVIAFGEARDGILADFGDAFPFKIQTLSTLHDATRYAMGMLSAGDTLLLSPASTSFDEFSSFEERGNFFKDLVKNAVFG